MAQEKRFHSGTSTSSSDRTLTDEPAPVSVPWLASPPTASRHKNARIREVPLPVEQMPLPPLPPMPAEEVSLVSPVLGRTKSKRKTLLERIEGWWDLGLLEKRQTMFGGNGTMAVR